MSIALTCDCGARFEVEDLFAGQEVNCPECQHPSRAPLVKNPPRRVSLLALYSLVVAVVGAFTLVGSAAGALLALVALARMHTGRRGGMGYAIAALVVAVAGAGATVGILYYPATSQFVGWQKRGGVASRVDTSGPPQVGSRDNACVLTRPPGWGRLLQDRGVDPAVDYLQTNRELILTGPRGEEYIDIGRDTAYVGQLEGYRDRLAQELQTSPTAADDKDDNPVGGKAKNFFSIDSLGKLDDIDGYERWEWDATLQRGNKSWRWLLRAYRKKADIAGKARTVYVLRAYAPASRFEAIQPELRKALDSVRFPP